MGGRAVAGGSGQSIFAVAHDCGDVGNRTRVHIAAVLVLAPHTNDLNLLTIHPGKQRLDVLCPNIKANEAFASAVICSGKKSIENHNHLYYIPYTGLPASPKR